MPSEISWLPSEQLDLHQALASNLFHLLHQIVGSVKYPAFLTEDLFFDEPSYNVIAPWPDLNDYAPGSHRRFAR
jgi:hypothetical protein